MATRAQKQITLREPQAMRALTHPARIAIIDELYGGRVATATELSELTGLSPNATGWHLRALARLGIVEPAPATGDARQRPWRAAGSGVAVDARLPTRAQHGAATALISAALDTLGRDLAAYAAAEVDLPDDWQARANFDSGAVYLTPTEVGALIDAVQQAVAPFRQRARRRPGSQRVRITTGIVPIVDR